MDIKNIILLAASISLAIAFTIYQYCNDNGKILESNKGTEFAALTLGLQPGSTTDKVNFNWYAKTSDGNKSYVKIFKGNKFVKKQEGTSGAASESFNWHKVTIDKLDQDTKYSYWVSNNGTDWSYEYSYKTPSSKGTFKFAYVGDPQLTKGNQDTTSNWFSSDKTTAKGWSATVEKIANANASFILIAGDQVDITANGDEDEYANFFAPAELRNIPFAPSVGNHDRHCPFLYHYNLPNEQNAPASCTGDGQATVEKEAGNYFYLYNNILFVALNTSYYPTSTADAVPIISNFDAVITAAKAANNGKYTWIIVQHHKSTASVADHIADRDIGYYVEAGFERIMTKHGVDFVLAGHDHVYARSYVMKTDEEASGNYGAGTVVSTDFNNISLATNPGTIYLTATTASGLKYYDLFDGNETTINKNLLARQHKIPGYTMFEVNGNSINVKTYDINSYMPIDKFTVAK
jgi:hypothetical protein